GTRPRPFAAYSPLFQVALEFQNDESAGVELSGLRLEGVSIGAGMVKEDLEFVLGERFDGVGEPAGISGVVAFATDLFDRETVQGFADRFVRIVEAASSDPERPVGDIGILHRTNWPGWRPRAAPRTRRPCSCPICSPRPRAIPMPSQWCATASS
ncbi:hypothetical protein GS979_07510, partial [Rhodococcus hoagii]|nr:hypothetical protein [Prescottella equi]